MALNQLALRAYSRKPIPVPANHSLGHLNLPSDYATLGPKAKKEARLNGMLLQDSPERFVRAWNLFRTYYLSQLPNGVFYKDLLPSPPCHFDAVRDLATYQLNAWAFPRGSGKSTVLGQEIPLLMLITRPHYDLLTILAKDDFVRKRFSRYMRMFEENEYILNDWGAFRPPRGANVWNHHLIQLTNGAQLQGLAVEGKMLGERPDLILADDPEHDKAMVANPNPSALLEAFERLLFGTIMPMLREGSCLGWIGTLLDARSFLYEVEHSNDPRYRFWNRRVLAGLQADGRSLWPERWNKEAMQKLREMWGESYFQTHMMNRPGHGTNTIFVIHPDFCTYNVKEEDEEVDNNPLQSKAIMVVNRPVKKGEVFEKQVVERDYGVWASNLYRVMTVDFAFTVTKRSDFSCAHILGFENNDMFHDTLYSLDMWLGKKTPAEFIQILLGLAYKWRVRLIAAEAVTIQQQLVDQIQAGVEILQNTEGWAPKVLPIRYPSNLKKPERIGALEWRFSKYRVKLPAWRRETWPYKELWRQAENFSPDMAKLPYDDAIETLSMYQYVGRPRSRWQFADAGEKHVSAVEMLKQGETHDKFGVPYLSSLSRDEIPVRELMTRQAEENEREGRVSWNQASAI